MQGQSEDTSDKQRRKLQPIMRIIFTSMKYRADHLVMVDLNAGAGRNHLVGEVGSPILALHELAQIGKPSTLACFESHQGRRIELEDTLALERRRCLADQISGLIFTDNTDLEQVDWLTSMVPSGNLRGLVYADPNGATIPAATIRRLTRAPGWGRVDVLLHLSATAMKRARGASASDPDLAHWSSVTITGWLEAIGKRFWWITEPAGRHQWVFLFGSQWEGFPGLGGPGFQPISSRDGSDWLTKCEEVGHAAD